jgi:hypothetical protein
MLVFSHFISGLAAIFGAYVPAWAVPLVVGILTREIYQLGTWGAKKLLGNKKTAPLAEGVIALEDATVAALKAGAEAYPRGQAQALAAAGKAAEGAFLKDAPSLAAAASAEVAALTDEPTGGTAVTPSGNVSVNLPALK